jgi:hypothetical protein
VKDFGPPDRISRHGMQAALLATSLLLVAAMLGSLFWLATQRVPVENEE